MNNQKSKINYGKKYLKYKSKYINSLENNNLLGGASPAASPVVAPTLIFIMGASGTVGRSLVYELRNSQLPQVFFYPIVRPDAPPEKYRVASRQKLLTNNPRVTSITQQLQLMIQDNQIKNLEITNNQVLTVDDILDCNDVAINQTLANSFVIISEIDKKCKLIKLLFLIKKISDSHTKGDLKPNIFIVNAAADKDGTLTIGRLRETIATTKKPDTFDRDTKVQKQYYKSILDNYWCIMQIKLINKFMKIFASYKIKLIHLSTVYVHNMYMTDRKQYDEMVQNYQALLASLYDDTKNDYTLDNSFYDSDTINKIEDALLTMQPNENTQQMEPVFFNNNYIYGYLKLRTEQLLQKEPNNIIIRLPGLFDEKYCHVLEDTSPGNVFNQIINQLNILNQATKDEVKLDNVQIRYPISSSIVAKFIIKIITESSGQCSFTTLVATPGNQIVNFRGLHPITKWELSEILLKIFMKIYISQPAIVEEGSQSKTARLAAAAWWLAKKVVSKLSWGTNSTPTTTTRGGAQPIATIEQKFYTDKKIIAIDDLKHSTLKQIPLHEKMKLHNCVEEFIKTNSQNLTENLLKTDTYYYELIKNKTTSKIIKYIDDYVTLISTNQPASAA